MNTRKVLDVSTTTAELDIERTALFFRIIDAKSKGVDLYETTQKLNIDFGGDEDDPNYIVIEPIENIADAIDQPGGLPEPKVLYSYTDKTIGVDVKDVTFKELVRAVLVALDGDYGKI